MAHKPVKIPGPDHPISIEANPYRITITVGGKVIADTRDALTLREADYPARSLYPSSRRRYDVTRAQRAHVVLPVQGRRLLLQHSGWRRSVRSMLSGLTRRHSNRWDRSRSTSPFTQTVSTRLSNRQGLEGKFEATPRDFPNERSSRFVERAAARIWYWSCRGYRLQPSEITVACAAIPRSYRTSGDVYGPTALAVSRILVVPPLTWIQ